MDHDLANLLFRELAGLEHTPELDLQDVEAASRRENAHREQAARWNRERTPRPDLRKLLVDDQQIEELRRISFRYHRVLAVDLAVHREPSGAPIVCICILAHPSLRAGWFAHLGSENPPLPPVTQGMRPGRGARPSRGRHDPACSCPRCRCVTRMARHLTTGAAVGTLVAGLAYWLTGKHHAQTRRSVSRHVDRRGRLEARVAHASAQEDLRGRAVAADCQRVDVKAEVGDAVAILVAEVRLVTSRPVEGVHRPATRRRAGRARLVCRDSQRHGLDTLRRRAADALRREVQAARAVRSRRAEDPHRGASARARLERLDHLEIDGAAALRAARPAGNAVQRALVAGLGRLDDAISAVERVAGVAEAIAIGVFLAGIVQRRTVVGGIRDFVPITVGQRREQHDAELAALTRLAQAIEIVVAELADPHVARVRPAEAATRDGVLAIFLKAPPGEQVYGLAERGALGERTRRRAASHALAALTVEIYVGADGAGIRQAEVLFGLVHDERTDSRPAW